jgi:hypothetical protein
MSRLFDELDDVYDLLYRDGCKLESLRGALQRSQEALYLLYRDAKTAMAGVRCVESESELQRIHEAFQKSFEKLVESGGGVDFYDDHYHAGTSSNSRSKTDRKNQHALDARTTEWLSQESEEDL